MPVVCRSWTPTDHRASHRAVDHRASHPGIRRSGSSAGPVDEAESRRANGPDWDRYADEYQSTHGEFLGDAGFVWGPRA